MATILTKCWTKVLLLNLKTVIKQMRKLSRKMKELTISEDVLWVLSLSVYFQQKKRNKSKKTLSFIIGRLSSRRNFNEQLLTMQNKRVLTNLIQSWLKTKYEKYWRWMNSHLRKKSVKLIKLEQNTKKRVCNRQLILLGKNTLTMNFAKKFVC
jgi:hypothetical protein